MTPLLALAGLLVGCAEQPAAPPPANCAEATKQARASPSLQIQGGDEAAIAREGVKVRLARAEAAAAAGNEAECWKWLGLANIRR